MRTTSTMPISLPPTMVEEVERIRKTENRTRPELVRKALRTYFMFQKRFPVVNPSKAELAAIKRGRAAFDRGEYVSLNDLLHGMEPSRIQTRAKSPRKASRKRSKRVKKTWTFINHH